MAYIHFTDEQKQQANSVDLVDFLQRQGEQLVRSGREWRWKRHDSVTVRGDQWFRHSRKEGGHAIDFVQQFFDMSFPEAMNYLLGEDCGVEWNQTAKSAPAPRKEFALPEANYDMRRVFAYLIKQRFIDREVLSHFAHHKLIYEDKEYHNAVFVGLDENGVPRHAHKRGTYTQREPYKGNVEGSDPSYSFHWIGESDTLYVFEAPIDMLSFITLHPQDWQRHSYVTLDGVSEHAMLRQLKLNPHLKNAVLCLDHDEAGIEATGRLKDILAEHDYYDPVYMDIPVMQPQYKDWNEDIHAQYGLPAIPAQEHPKLELLPRVCSGLAEACASFRSPKEPHALLTERYRLLAPLVANGKLPPAREVEIAGHLRFIAAAAVHAAQKEYRQMERPVATDELVRQLEESYRPHQDRGWLRTKAEDIRLDVAALDRQLRAAGLRSPQDKQNLAASYMRLALNCVKAQLAVTLDTQKQLPVQEEAASNFIMTM